MFIDEARITVIAGDGGDGCVSFRREKYVPKGGPNGGDGGVGGSIVARVNPHLRTLLDFRHQPRFKADRGEHGMGQNCSGKAGKNLVIQVPRGTVITDIATGEVVGDLTRPDQEIVLAAGGRGGKGNQHYATPTHQAPREFEYGRPGETRELKLELKLLADVGLVGFPNAGKSTLLSVVSRARPKVADYPFTTLEPHLGIARLGRTEEGRSLVVADIPGLIEGASQGKGLGHQFLRHIERTRVLLIMIDATAEDPEVQEAALLRELSEYSRQILDKPRITAFSKMDLLPPDAEPPTLGPDRSDVLHISAQSGQGMDRLLIELEKRVRLTGDDDMAVEQDWES